MTSFVTDLREENEADVDAIARLNRLVGGDIEASLVDRLRADRLLIASLVAVIGPVIVGHILLSHLPTQMDGREVRAAALAPMAVHPNHQRRGIGSTLVERGLSAVRERGIEAVIVLGHPAYYPRFGFSAALASRIAAPFSGEAFMALERVPGALKGASGIVQYPAAFGFEG